MFALYFPDEKGDTSIVDILMNTGKGQICSLNVTEIE